VTDRAERTVAVLAVDGGNSKTDLALIGWDGRLLAAVRGPTTSHQQVGLDAGTAALQGLIDGAARQAGIGDATAAVGSFTVAGADTRADTRHLRAAIGRSGVADDVLVVNDAFAPVRAGSERGWGVGLICGAGVNGAGIAPDGRTARFAAYGSISGDWGGGGDIGLAALGAAVRGRDGRGRRTSLEHAVPAFFGFRRPMDLTMAIERGRLPQDRLRALSPVVFEAAQAGDLVSREILDRLADELATMALAIIRRLGMTRLDVDVSLAGGVSRAADPSFEGRIEAGIRSVASRARFRRLDAPPVLGAALLGLDAMASSGRIPEVASAASIGRARQEVTFEAFDDR
jgi:N-acetylglucosamine kinase-like BadF-type ATPase